MANNRLYLIEINDDDEVVNQLCIAKHFGGSWDVRIDENRLDDFLLDVFIHGNGIALRDEYMKSVPPAIYPYNDDIENGKWVFIKEGV